MKNNINIIKYWDNHLVEQHVLTEISYLKSYFPISSIQNLKYIDIGANVGKFYDILSKEYIIDRCIMVEPAPELFAYLQKKFEHLSNCELYNFAISDRTGYTKFHICSTEGDLSSVNLGLSRMIHNGDIEIKMLSGFDFLTQHINDLESIDFIKIDTENQDYQILRSIQPVIAQLKKKPFILFEHNYMACMSEQEARKILIDFTSTCNYESVDFDALFGDSFIKPNRITL